MLCTLKIKLAPTSEQHTRLLATMHRFNAACNHISEIAFREKTFNKVSIQKLCYYEVREKHSLSSQMVIRAISKVAESYKVDKKSAHTFRKESALVYDQRILSFGGLEFASLLTLDGRIKVPMVIGSYQQGIIGDSRVRGQADLIMQDRIFYLLLVVERPEPARDSAVDFLGVDLGVVNLATDSSGETFSGSVVNGMRHRHRRIRKRLQSKGTKSARRLLKKRRRKERRFAGDVNHCISKKIVAKAKSLGLGIAMEDLSGIRKRTEKTVKKSQRAQHSSWSFYQLRQFIEYKALLAGVNVVFVDPRNTSRTCPQCGSVDKKNRPTRDTFHCQCCGYVAPADNVAAVIIGRRAAVIQPYAV